MSDSNSGEKGDSGFIARLAAGTGSIVLAWIIVVVVIPFIAFLCLGGCALVLITFGGN